MTEAACMYVGESAVSAANDVAASQDEVFHVRKCYLCKFASIFEYDGREHGRNGGMSEQNAERSANDPYIL